MKKVRIIIFPILLLLLLSLSGCGKKNAEPDPHEGQVLVNDGFNDVWITPVEGVEVNPLTEEDFTVVNENPVYNGNLFSVKRGLDISEWNHEINWEELASEQLDFMIVRVGRRGTSQGGLAPDDTYAANLKNAIENGYDVGVYFFSQAVNVQEAIEEAEYTLSLIQGYDLTLPVFFDWENYDSEMRTYDVAFSTMTDCAVAFCEKVKSAGYDAGVYFGLQQGYYAYDLGRLSDYSFWVVNPGDFPDFYYAGDLWQYSIDTAYVSGIETTVDLNLLFIPNEEHSPEENPS